MKNNLLTGILVALLLLSTLATAGLVYKYNAALHYLNDPQVKREVVAAQAAESIMQSVVNDTLEYSKKNPDITRALQVTTPATTGKTAAPAAKPAK